MNKIHAALDFSGPQAVFAVEKDGNKIFEVSKLMQRRDAASFAEFLQSNLKAHGLDFADITHWTVGSGPGSFTGMRIAASFVQGLTYGKDVQTRTVPSAEAIAASAGLQKENACIIEFEDNSYCRLSAKAWYKVITEGLKVCGYGEGKRINSVEAEQCSGRCLK